MFLRLSSRLSCASTPVVLALQFSFSRYPCSRSYGSVKFWLPSAAWWHTPRIRPFLLIPAPKQPLLQHRLVPQVLKLLLLLMCPLLLLRLQTLLWAPPLPLLLLQPPPLLHSHQRKCSLADFLALSTWRSLTSNLKPTISAAVAASMLHSALSLHFQFYCTGNWTQRDAFEKNDQTVVATDLLQKVHQLAQCT